ncbi:MAG: hypothetical protein QM706_03225 [Nitrospira sp.]
MRQILLCGLLFIVSCKQRTATPAEPFKDWILLHQKELTAATDTLINDYKKEHTENNWGQISIAITNSMSGVLGQLADKAGDSTNCIVVELTFYNNPQQKRQLFLAATDSNCLQKLDAISLTPGHTNDFVYGKSSETLQ